MKNLNIRAAAGKADRNVIAFSAPVKLQAASAEGTGPKVPTFTMDAYTGGAMSLDGWQYPVVIDQEGWQDISGSLPILRDHDFGQLVGHTKETKVANGILVASGSISAGNAHANEVTASSANGFPWQASVGANVIKNQLVPEGESAQANGKTWQGPINIARRTSLSEISFVPLGADRNTAASIAANAAGVSAMNLFQLWAKAAGIHLSKYNAEQVASLKAAFKIENPDQDPEAAASAEQIAAADAGKDGKAANAGTQTTQIVAKGDGGNSGQQVDDANAMIVARRKLMAGESKRVAAIQKTCAGKHGEIEAKAIEEGWSTDKVELEVLRAERPKAEGGINAAFGINTGAGAAVTERVIAASAAINAGIPEKEAMKGLTEAEANIAAGSRMRSVGQSFYSLCAYVAAANGRRLPDLRMTSAVIDVMAHLTHESRTIQADGGVGFTTLSLPGLFSNVLNKKLLMGYGVIESVADDISTSGSTADFKPWLNVRLTMSGNLAPIGPDGEIKHLSLNDQSYTGGSDTQAAMITFTRKMMMNDDLNSLFLVTGLMGQKASISREKLIISLLIAAKSTPAPGADPGATPLGFNFFSTGANNDISGAGSALGIDGLTLAMKTLRQQKDPSGEPIFVTPTTLIVPPALEATALNLFSAQYLIASGITSTRKLEPNENVFKGRFKPIVSPYLGALSPIAGGTDTEWWLLGDPTAGAAPITVNYVQNMRTPTIQTGSMSFDQMGLGMRVFWDFGVALNDFRTAVHSEGI